MSHYHVTSIIWLSLEDYYNAGLTPEQAKDTIESMDDPASMGNLKLRCEKQFVNHNWNVHTGLTNPYMISILTQRIYRALDEALEYGPVIVSD